VGHVHSGALGWVGLISMGSLYYLIPRMYGRKQMFSVRAIELHFWIATIGIVLYIAAMWIAGVMQGLMWRAVNPDGTLVYSFVESVKATYPFYAIRLVGGVLFLVGMLIMAYNTVMTISGSRGVEAPIPATGGAGAVAAGGGPAPCPAGCREGTAGDRVAPRRRSFRGDRSPRDRRPVDDGRLSRPSHHPAVARRQDDVLRLDLLPRRQLRAPEAQ